MSVVQKGFQTMNHCPLVNLSSFSDVTTGMRVYSFLFYILFKKSIGVWRRESASTFSAPTRVSIRCSSVSLTDDNAVVSSLKSSDSKYKHSKSFNALMNLLVFSQTELVFALNLDLLMRHCCLSLFHVLHSIRWRVLNFTRFPFHRQNKRINDSALLGSLRLNVIFI